MSRETTVIKKVRELQALGADADTALSMVERMAKIDAETPGIVEEKINQYRARTASIIAPRQ